MGLFNRQPRRRVGIDIGTSSIKAVELSKKGSHLELLNYGVIDGLDFFGDISVSSNVPSTLKMSEGDIAVVLKKLFSFSKIETKDAVLSIPIFSSFLTVMELPLMGLKELEKAVAYQARSYIPVPLSEVVVDWLAIPPRGQENAAASLPTKKEKQKKDLAKTHLLAGEEPKGLLDLPPIPKSGPDKKEGIIEKPEEGIIKSPFDFNQPKAESVLDLPPIPSSKNTEKLPNNKPGGPPIAITTALGANPGISRIKAPLAKGQKKIQILLVAVPKEVISKYQRIAKSAGLNVLALEAESFSLLRSLTGNDLKTTMLMDFGARSTTLTLVDQGLVRMSHSVDLSGKEITNAIVRGLNVSSSRAEELKKEFGLAPKGVERGITKLITPLIDRLILEFGKISGSYMQKENEQVKRVILSGGPANLPGLANYLQEKLGIETIIGNPFARVKYPDELESVVKRELGTNFAVSVGLAMREF